jgi:hypothetical protein
MSPRDDDSDYFVCPHCGEELPRDATFCRHCGASDQSGWSTDDAWSEWEPGDPGEDDFDYDEFVAREFPDQVQRHAGRHTVRWTVTALVAAVLIVLLVLSAIF